jgi:tetratricopeptide (TPR) repeat protein
MPSCRRRSRAILQLGAAILLTNTLLAGPSVEQLLEQGAVFDRRFEPTRALEYYLRAEKMAPEELRVLLPIARQYRHLMADAQAKEEKVRLGRIGLRYAERAVAIAPEDGQAHLSVALSLGKMMVFLGPKEQASTCMDLKDAVDRTLQLDPVNDLAWHILGRWHRNLAEVSGLKRFLANAMFGLPKGSNEEAERCLNKAIDLNPSRLMHYIELGRVCAQEGRKDEARRLIEQGMAMPNVEKDDPDIKERGRETLARLH